MEQQYPGQPPVNPEEDIKLYKIGSIVNLRLSQNNKDLIDIFNEKKMQGIVISDYLADLVRRDADPNGSAHGSKDNVQQPIVAAPGALQLTNEQINQIAEQIAQRLSASGSFVPGSTLGMPAEESEEDRVKEELKNMANDLMDW